jgi:peptidoglycan hydrolase CwlO-like protein
MNTLWQYVQLRPHGARLLTSSARFWFRSVSALILAMACAEGVAWSYLGYLFGTGTARWLTAGFAGAMMFTVVWIVDTSLVTLDRAWAEHARTLLGVKMPSPVKVFARDAARFGLRIGLLCASLTVTAPYLAQVVFHPDIEASIRASAVKSLNSARSALAVRYDNQLLGLQTAIAAQNGAYEREVAGKGTSGRYGNGPAAQAMLADAAKLDRERERVQREKADALTRFNSLAADWQSNRDQISALYAVKLSRTSILENRRILDELRKRPENRETEWAIRVFLAIVFLGVLLLKIFEPSSVRLYLSEVLQQEYSRYLAGAFDGMLLNFEKSTAPKPCMPPQRLYEFLARVWVPANSHPRTVAAAQSLAMLENIRLQINSELEQVSNQAGRVCNEANEASRSLVELRSAITMVSGDVDQFTAELNGIEKRTSSLDMQARVEYESYLRGKLASANLKLHELQDAIPSEMERHQRACQAVTDLESRLNEKQAELISTQEKIRAIRSDVSAYVGAAASAVLGSN